MSDDLDQRLSAMFAARDRHNRETIDAAATQVAVQERAGDRPPAWRLPAMVMAGGAVVAAVLFFAGVGGDDTTTTEIPPVTGPPPTTEPDPDPTEPTEPPPAPSTERTPPSFAPTTGTMWVQRRPGPEECTDLTNTDFLLPEPGPAGSVGDIRGRLFNTAVNDTYWAIEELYPAELLVLSSLPSGDTWEDKAAFRPDLTAQIARSLCEGSRENADGSFTYPGWYGQPYEDLTETQQLQVQQRLALIDITFDPDTIFMETGAVVVTIRADGLVTEIFTWWD